MAGDKQPFESTLQDLVYSLDAGTGLKIVRTILFCLFVLALAVLFTAKQFRGLDSEEAMDYAQLGRNLSETGKFVTKCVRPLSIHEVGENTFDGNAKIQSHPDLLRAPGYPVVLAACFKVFDLAGVDLFPDSEAYRGKRLYPAEQWVIVPLHHIFTMLSGLMLYLLGRRLFSHKIGLLGATAYFLSLIVWQDVLCGTAIPLVTFLVLGAVYFALLTMVWRRERRVLWKWMLMYVLSILFSAAAFLTNYGSIVIVAGIALFIWLMGSRAQRGTHLAFFYVVFSVLLAFPWFLRNYDACGAPFGLALHTALVNTDNYPDDTLMRTLPEDGTNPFSFFSDFAAVRKKWAKNFASFYQQHLTAMGSGILMAFFIVTYFYRFVRVHVHNLHLGIGLSMILFLIGAGYFSEDAYRLYHIFWPFVILYGLAFFVILLDRLDIRVQIYKTALTALVVFLTAIPLIITMFIAPPPGSVYPPYYPPFILHVSGFLKPSEVMCTDMPWATAWYGNRTSILLPLNLDDYYRINDYHKFMSGFYMTTLTKDRPMVSSLLVGSEKAWLPVSMGQVPDGFPLTKGFPLNNQDQIFLCESMRWAQEKTENTEGSGNVESGDDGAGGETPAAEQPAAEQPAAEETE